jgi:copper chaperone CopZ
VSLGKGEATVTFSPDSNVTEEQVRKAVRDAGFTPGSIEWSDTQEK